MTPRRSRRQSASQPWPANWKPQRAKADVRPDPARASLAKSPAPRQPVVTTNLDALFVPGVGVIVDPDQAERLGAFIEDALTPDDALAAQDEE